MYLCLVIYIYIEIHRERCLGCLFFWKWFQEAPKRWLFSTCFWNGFVAYFSISFEKTVLRGFFGYEHLTTKLQVINQINTHWIGMDQQTRKCLLSQGRGGQTRLMNPSIWEIWVLRRPRGLEHPLWIGTQIRRVLSTGLESLRNALFKRFTWHTTVVYLGIMDGNR